MGIQQVLTLASMVGLLLCLIGLAVFSFTNSKPVLHWACGVLCLSLTTFFVMKIL